MKKYILLVDCRDSKNIIAEISNFVSDSFGNITYLDQHVDEENDIFFMRLEFEVNENQFSEDEFRLNFRTKLSSKFGMQWNISASEEFLRMAIFVSKYDHCLYDLLARYKSNELHVEIPFIVSNHADLKTIADNFGIPFFHIPVTTQTKAQAEKKQLALLKKYKVDFIVLARYMQIVSPGLINEYRNNIINIHHSFLPAFIGAKPYHSAFKRGVKIIGATSHYITEELDAGPIIAQDVSHVSHTYSIQDLIAKGRDLEKIVLSQAVKLHAKRKVMVFNNKTVIFS
jgi:formyltetrahydrofolate deformylase